MGKRLLLVLAALLALAFLVAGCGPAEKKGSAKSEIKVGLTVSNTGDFAFASEQGFKGIHVWADEVNKNGGIYVKELNKKLPVKLVYYDDRSDKQLVARLYEKLIKEDKVDLVIAPFGSTLTSAAAVVTEKYKMPLIIWSAAADSIYEQGYKYVISATEVPASLMPKPEIDHMARLGVKKLAIVYLDEPFPAQQADGAKKFAEKSGINVVLYEKFAKENMDYSTLLNKAKAAGADALYVSAYMEEQANFIRQMKEQNIMFNYVYMVYAGQTKWPDLTGNDGQYIFGHTLFDPHLKWKVTAGDNVDQFMHKFKEMFPDAKNPPDFQTSLAYGAGVMLQQFVEQAGNLKADAIKQAAIDLSSKATVMTGKYILDPSGKQLGMPFVVTQVAKDNNGKYKLELVYPDDIATAKPVYPIPGWSKRK